jgi:hypothetical protein
MNVMAGSWLIASVYFDAAAPAGPHGRDDRVLGLAARHSGEALVTFDRGRDFLAVVFVECWLVIKEVDVREAFALEEAEDALGARGEVGKGRQTPGGAGG